MACRVGITMDPERRRSEWRLSHPNLFNRQILQTHSTKSAVQAAEHEFAAVWLRRPSGRRRARIRDLARLLFPVLMLVSLAKGSTRSAVQ